MNVRLLRSVVLAIAAVLAAVACNNPTPEGPESAPPTPDPSTYSRQIDSYVAVAPRVLHSGQTHNITASLFQGKEPAQGSVSLTLSKPETGRVIAEATGFVQGSGPVPLSVPELSEGGYTLTVAGDADVGAFFESAEVQVRAASTILFLETDKPIYKPGQLVNIRALRLDQDLKPLPGPLTVEVQDAKGIKVYKRMIDVDRFGMANATLPLSTEPNLGVWKLSADSGDRTTQLVLSQLGIGICLRKGPIEVSCLVESVDGGDGSDGQGQIRGAAGTGTTGRAPAFDSGWQKLSPSDR